MQYFPAFIDLRDQAVLIVGGGEVAARKTELVVAAGARVRLVTPVINASLRRLVDQASITWLAQGYTSEHLANARLCFACTDDQILNRQIHAQCEARGILVNVVDNPPLCRFITPSIVNRDPIQVAIASGGKAPVLVRYLREKLEALLSPTLGELGAFAGRMRPAAKAAFATVDARRRFWERFFSGPASESRNDAEREALFQRALSESQGTPMTGCLYLLVADGNPDNITLGTLRAMQQADAVFYSAKAPEAILALVRRDAERQPLQAPDQVALAIARVQSGERILVLLGTAQNSWQSDIEQQIQKSDQKFHRLG